MKNKLILGLAEKTELLLDKQGFLLIDDGPLCDICLERFKRAKLFDPYQDSINPLRGIDYKRSRELASILYGAEGKDTLTVRNGKRALTKLLLSGKSRLDKLLPIPAMEVNDATLEALATVNDILMSPVLRGVLCKPTNSSLRAADPPSSIVARIDRAKLGEFNAFLLGSLLVSMYPGQIIISDFGFYARDFHTSLIRQNRPAIGVNALAELDRKMQQMVLLIEDKEGRHCTHDDAEVLAKYAGHVPSTIAFNDFVGKTMA